MKDGDKVVSLNVNSSHKEMLKKLHNSSNVRLSGIISLFSYLEIVAFDLFIANPNFFHSFF